MNTYKVEFKTLSKSSKEPYGSVSYYDIDGKVAFKINVNEYDVSCTVESISEESVHKYFSMENSPYYDIKVTFIKTGKTSPFESLNKDYCREITPFKFTNEVFIREEDGICHDEVQERYSPLSIEDKVHYLNRPRHYEDF